ncbi:MAG: hypothetical protein WC784_02365 [Candidatus Shapirobacteria bacterium]
MNSETNKNILNELNPREIIEMGIKHQRRESIPISKVFLEDSIVDEDHRDELKASMDGDRGQISPVTLRARILDDEVVYDVIDGFHRGSVKKLDELITGKTQYLDAIVLYGCDDEEMFDLRVLAVSSVRSISFTRLITWMQKSYEQTKWFEMGLTLSQIVSVAVRSETNRSNLGLSNEEISEARDWATKKAKKWNQTLSVLYQNTKAAENADPELIKKVRVGAGGGHEGHGIINPAKLRAIVEELPGQYLLQNIVADIIVKYNIDSEKTGRIAKLVLKERNNSENLELIKADPLMALKVFEKETAENNPEESLNMLPDTRSLHSEKANLRDKKGKELEVENIILRRTVTFLREKMKLSGNNEKLWYELVPDLSPNEMEIGRMFFKEGNNINEIAVKFDILPHKVFQLLQSITSKYLILNQDLFLNDICLELENKN